MSELKRCKWCNPKNAAYIKYHDEEWGVQNFNEQYLFEMLILESFQAGLSWECVLNKREAFAKPLMALMPKGLLLMTMIKLPNFKTIKISSATS